MWGMGSRTDFSHIFLMLNDINMRSGLSHFFYIALLNDLGSVALCMSDRLFDSAHSSTASPSLSVVSASKWREQKLFSWWYVHGMYHYTGYVHCYELNTILFTDRNAVNLQTISYKSRASMFVVCTFNY